MKTMNGADQTGRWVMIGLPVVLAEFALCAMPAQAQVGPSVTDTQPAFQAEVAKLDTMRGNRDIAGLQAEIPVIERSWTGTAGNAYPGLIAYACVQLQTIGDHTAERRRLIHDTALMVLRRGEPEADTELALLELIASGDWSADIAARAATWPAERREEARLWARASARIVKLAAGKLDPGDMPIVSPGPKPKDTTDQDWQEFLKQNREKAARRSALMRAKTLLTLLPPEMRGFLVRAYAAPPRGDAELHEMLAQTGLDAATANGIEADAKAAADKKEAAEAPAGPGGAR